MTFDELISLIISVCLFLSVSERATVNQQVKHLKVMNGSIKKLVEAGQVVAVQRDRSGLSSSRITLQDGQLHLHTLLHQSPPTHSYSLQHSDVVGILEPSSTMAFLDLAWGGSTKGRVYIRLRADTGLGRQFMSLCTGNRGSSYLNTKLFRVGNKGWQGKCVKGGDSKHNTQAAAPPLTDQLEQYQRSRSAGTVCSPWGLTTSQFIISTRSHTHGCQWDYVFGKVVSGLDIVREAVNHMNILEVTVVDCGVVLAL
nr:peptidyl-prolyl cis-trans isomerase-like isoform X1 [Cherax quadricarinatus]